MKERLIHHTISFKNAFAGLFYAIKTQPNFIVHFTLATLAIILGVILQISYLEMTVIIFCIVLGLASEMINTSIESMTDLIKKEYSMEAKIAKDVSAGMMLLTAFGTIVVALLIFVPYII